MVKISQKPLLIFGGTYSNYQATQALQKWALAHGFTAEQLVCTGDIIAYCAKPVETVELVQEWLGSQGLYIKGNVEQSLANKSEDCGCGFVEGSVCDALSKDWYSYAQTKITDEHRQWFTALPEQLSFNYHNTRIQIVHGAPSNISRFMFSSQSDEEFFEEFAFKDINADIIIAGHSGLPFTKRIKTQDGKIKTWHNSGALGMPANDGTQRVWFSVLDRFEGEKLRFTHHYLDYDAVTAQREMVEVGLVQGYQKSLITGLWPSVDVLPEFERSQQGIRLNPS